MQAETLASAYRLWRRNWKGKGREYTAGALVWQVSTSPKLSDIQGIPCDEHDLLAIALPNIILTSQSSFSSVFPFPQINDCWPVTSWAIVDYFLRPKPAYFAIKRELRPYTVGMTRKDEQVFPDALSAARFTIETKIEIWGTNSTLDIKNARLEVATFDLADAEAKPTVFLSTDVELAPNAATELWKGTLPGQPTRTKASEVPKTIIVSARLLEKGDGGAVLARYSNWCVPVLFENRGFRFLCCCVASY